MNILIVASSSGGHVYPALSFGNYLLNKGESVTFLGIKKQIEENIFPHDKSIFIEMPKSFKKSLKKPINTFCSFKEINSLIDRFEIIVAFGGFISFIVSVVPNIKKKLLYLHEANVDIGDANKIALINAKNIFTTFKITESKFYKQKMLCVGNPVYEDILNLKKKDNYICFVFGSLGSKTLLDIVSDFLLEQHMEFKFLLVTSKKYYYEYSKKLSNVNNVKTIEYVNRKELYENSKLIFCRGGASTLTEVVASKTNCICIPSPYVKHHHQERNAIYLNEQRLLTTVFEKDFTTKKIYELINFYQRNDFPIMEIKNQKDFLIKNPSLLMYLKIKDDYSKK